MYFPFLHGPNGEDGTIQGFLELFSIPFVGSKALGSSVCMDKDVCKRLLLQEGLQTVNGVVLNSYRNDFRLLLDAKTKDRFCANYQKKREEFLEKKYPVSELNKKKEATVIPIFPLDPIHSKLVTH